MADSVNSVVNNLLPDVMRETIIKRGNSAEKGIYPEDVRRDFPKI